MSSSVDMLTSPASREEFQKIIEYLQQENGVLEMELDTFRMRIKNLQEKNEAFRQASQNIVVDIYAKAEQEEEFMYNTLLKQIQTLKKEKETLALNYERAECLISGLRYQYAMAEKEEVMYNTLLKQIKTLIKEKETLPLNYEQERRQKWLREQNRLRREKFHLEQTKEEEEALVNKPMRKIEKLRQFFRKIFRK